MDITIRLRSGANKTQFIWWHSGFSTVMNVKDMQQLRSLSDNNLSPMRTQLSLAIAKTWER
jgi:hypothetical protein